MEKTEAYLSYLRHEKRYSNHTLIAYQKDLEQFNTFLKDQTNNALVYEKITPKDIRNWVVKLSDGGVSSSSIGRKISCLRSFFKYLLRHEIISKNPAENVVTPKLTQKLPEFIEEKAMQNLLDTLPFPTDFEGHRDKTMIELTYQTGIRRSELIHLKIDDINFKGQQIKVLGKRNKERIIPITPNLCKLIHEYIELRKNILSNESYLFLTKKGRKLNPKLVYNKINYYIGLVSTISKKSPHILRHTFATHMLNKGADLNAIKELLGHSSLASTQVYTHNSFEKLISIYKLAHPRA